MANHNAGGSSSFTSTASNGLLLPLGMLSSTRRSSNNHAQIHHQLPRVQSPPYGGQQQHHHHHHHHNNQNNQLSHHHHQHHHQQSSSSISQLPPLRSSSAMPQVNSRPQVRRRSNSVTANNLNISLNSSSNSTNNNSNNSSTASNNSSPVRPTVSTMADSRVLSGNSSSVTHGSSPTSANSGSFSTVAGLPVGRPDMASATISPRIRRLVGSASSARGAPSVSSSSSSGGDEHHRNRRSSASSSSHGRRRLSLDLSSIVPDHRRLRESLRERVENAGHNSSSSMSLNISNGVSSNGGNSNSDTIGKSSSVVASTSSVATPSPPPAIDIRPTLNPIASCPVPVASSSRAPSIPPKSTNATSPSQAGITQSSQLSTELEEQQISGADKSKLKGKEVNVKFEGFQDSSNSSDTYTAKNAVSNNGVPASAAEMLSELEKELTCSVRNHLIQLASFYPQSQREAFLFRRSS